MTQYFLCPDILSANKQILNSHITMCPKITVFKNPQGGGGGFSYLAHGLLVFRQPFKRQIIQFEFSPT